MKLENRERVDDTRITIGRRVHYRVKKGDESKTKKKVSGCYAAEYRDWDGKQVCQSLGTTSRREARRKALEIQQDLESGTIRAPEVNPSIIELISQYKQSYEARNLAPKTESKYKADLDKLEKYCVTSKIIHARRFSENHLFGYRKWLKEEGYADKTIEGASILAKQMFKWAWRQKLLTDYHLVSASFPKAKAKPQPCYTSQQVDALICAGDDEEKVAFALMGYAGLRIGEVEQLHWQDLQIQNGSYKMIHIRRGGSNGTTKDKDERFVPVHPTIIMLFGPAKKRSGLIFKTITARQLLKRVKTLCEACEFENPEQYKLHSFRHHFASLCANHSVAYRKALAWLGHSSSQMLDLYYHLHDDDSQRAMAELAKSTLFIENSKTENTAFEGNLRAMGESKIEKTLQVPEVQELVASLSNITERAGFEPAV
ncbi:MAG: tyrosine-type recombinase/integrase, partial [Phycisphaeraceae bacterium]|nr:tyrosine-type recombinase/integrase [Phycisphaeraceae bacterium]